MKWNASSALNGLYKEKKATTRECVSFSHVKSNGMDLRRGGIKFYDTYEDIIPPLEVYD